MPASAADLLSIRRLAIGSSSDYTTLPDADLQALWDDALSGNGDVYLTAAAACDLLAAQYGLKIPRWTADGQSIDRTTQPAFWLLRARQLRAVAANGGALVSGQIVVTRPAVATTNELTS